MSRPERAIPAAREEVPDGGVCPVKAKCLLVSVAGISLLACLGAVFADGTMFIRRPSYTYADLLQPTQKAYIRWDGTQEKLLIQTKYEGPAEEMVWIIPVPSQPTVERADGSVFQDLSKLTADYAIDYTDFPGLNMMAWSTTSGGGGGSGTAVVEWHERIGDYEVALLRPVGGEDVIQWLNTNGYAVPETINPVLEDYVRQGWWMVAARIHPEALTPITRDKLAQGTLHPLEMTFRSSVCLYPMRLTRVAAGPVEELIYIEGPHHYEPATLAGDSWEISLFGGPVRKVVSTYYLSAVEQVVEIFEGRIETECTPRLTRLRRVFQPSEMTDDLVFRELDLAQWLADRDLTRLARPKILIGRWGDAEAEAEAEFARYYAGSVPVRMAQAATQYGRWRDPNGVVPLTSALAPEVLDQVKPTVYDCQSWSPGSVKFLNREGVYLWDYPPTAYDWPAQPTCVPLRSCIWALGEIALEHPLGEAAEETLLRCTQHDNQIIRMEACIALAKMRSSKLGPLFIERLTRWIPDAPPSAAQAHFDPDVHCAMAEMDILADWIGQFGTTDHRNTLVDLLREAVAKVPVDTEYLYPEQAAVSATTHGCWPTWIVWRAACTRDSRLIPVLESRHPPCTNGQADCVPDALLRAEAACGSAPAAATLVRQAVEHADEVLHWDRSRNIAHTSLGAFYDYSSTASLRVMILVWKPRVRYELFPMASDTADCIFRSALTDGTLTDWHLLYLLAQIKHPGPQDEEILLRIWDKHEEPTQLLVVDVLYAWRDISQLRSLYDQPGGSAGARAEIAWALAALAVPEAASIIEEQVRDSWNPGWLAGGWTFVHEVIGSRAFPHGRRDYLSPDLRRAEQTLWNYFHPTAGVLDGERLACLKRLAADGTIHAGMRFDLLGVDYGGTAWGLPLLEQAARDILAVDSTFGTVQKIISTMESVGNSGFVVHPAGN